MTVMKVRDDKREHTRIEKAGAKAERDFAYLLNRKFGTDSNVAIINDLRFLDAGGSTTQIDHLVISRWGTFIVETKSVTSRIRINEHAEFERFWNGNWAGMPSPIAQAELQRSALKSLLLEHQEAILGKLLGLQRGFGNYPIEAYVAISPEGSISRPANLKLGNLQKADQLVHGLAERVGELKGTRQTFAQFMVGKNMDKDHVALPEKDCRELVTFLLDRHRPTSSAPPSPSKTPGNSTCRHCQSAAISLMPGRYSYYFKCRDCDGNTSIALPDGTKLRKDGQKFYLVNGNRETPFHVNP